MAVTAEKVRELVARFPGTQESAHHGHPDFRVQQKIFATLSTNEDRAALRLTHLEARELSTSQPAAFRLVAEREPIAWVSVLLEAVDEDEFTDLLAEAWQLRAPDDLVNPRQSAGASPTLRI